MEKTIITKAETLFTKSRYWKIFFALLFLQACNPLSDFSTFSVDEENDFDSLVEVRVADPKMELKSTAKFESEYLDVHNKNLFSPDRLFVEPTEELTVEPSAVPALSPIDVPSLELVGTLKTSSDVDYAFIRNTADKDSAKRNKVFKYEIGQWIGDYLISKIDASKVTLIKGDEVAIVKLKSISNKGGRPTQRGVRQSSSRTSPSGRSTREMSPEEKMKWAEEEASKPQVSSGLGNAAGRETRGSSFSGNSGSRGSGCGSSSRRSSGASCGR